MGFKVRPFERIIERPEETSAVKVCGSIADGAFKFSMEGACWSLPFVESGVDDHGAYAILKACQIELADGFIAAVEENVDGSDDEGYPAAGCKISLFKPGDRKIHEAIMREQGLSPEEAELLVPPVALIAVFIGPSGRINGDACMGLPREHPFQPTDPKQKRSLH